MINPSRPDIKCFLLCSIFSLLAQLTHILADFSSCLNKNIIESQYFAL